MKPDNTALAKRRCRLGLHLGLFATCTTLVILGVLLFGNHLLDKLSDGRRAAYLNLAIWAVIVSACCAIGNAFAGRRARPKLAWVGIGLGVLPFLLLASYITIHGPRHPAPSTMQDLRDRGAELILAPNFAPNLQALASLRPPDEWCLVRGPATNSLPVLFSSNLRSDLTSLAQLRGPVYRSLDPAHPLGADWLVTVYPNGRAHLVDTSTASWDDVLPRPRPQNRTILRP